MTKGFYVCALSSVSNLLKIAFVWRGARPPAQILRPSIFSFWHVHSLLSVICLWEVEKCEASGTVNSSHMLPMTMLVERRIVHFRAIESKVRSHHSRTPRARGEYHFGTQRGHLIEVYTTSDRNLRFCATGTRCITKNPNRLQ